MQSKLVLASAGLAIGLSLSAFSPRAAAITSFFPNSSCFGLCLTLYQECVAERGLKAGCGRELNNCQRFCLTGTL